MLFISRREQDQNALILRRLTTDLLLSNVTGNYLDLNNNVVSLTASVGDLNIANLGFGNINLATTTGRLRLRNAYSSNAYIRIYTA
jgi:hypothetical protein